MAYSHPFAQRLRLLLLMASCAASVASPALATEKPNIVYVIADDMGWKDVGFHGGRARTPNLDRLALGGAMLNAFYVQQTSSQSRAAAITGRYPMRYGLQTGTLTATSSYCLPEDERTMGNALKEVGYRTAFIGKWQLGHAKPECLPTRRGFDSFYGPLTHPKDYLIKKGTKVDWRQNDKPIKVEGEVTGLIAKAAAAHLRQVDSGSPFFLLVSFTAPAAPFGADKMHLDAYPEIEDADLKRYLAAITRLDQTVGEMLVVLEQRKLIGNTLIIFHSDSGAALPVKFPTADADVAAQVGDNDVFREGRGSLYEGGLRVPALMYWSGKFPAGNIVYDPVHVTDVVATLFAMVGASPHPKKKLDGLDLSAALSGKARSPRKEILLNVEDFHGALRVGEFKLIVHSALPTKLELFHIPNDPEETDNIAEREPERTRALLKRLNDYAYDMMPALQVEEWSAARGDSSMLLWRTNPPRR